MTAYRANDFAKCPGCGVTMDQQAIEAATIDVCRECGGVWADSEDGDVGTIATEARIPVDADDEPSRSLGPCPRCDVALRPIVAGEGVELHQCDKCRGVFLARSSLDAAMWLCAGDLAPPPKTSEGIAAWLRWLFDRLKL